MILTIAEIKLARIVSMFRKIVLFIIILTVLFTASVLFGVVSADCPTYSWYCIRVKNHARPPLPSEFQEIKKYDGYYIGNDPDKKVVYLTFDAGYENGNVTKILDVLERNSVKGAFFILNNLIKSSPDLVKRMGNDGHLVCNHTANHKDMSVVANYNAFAKEILSLETLYESTTERKISKFFRPPEGKFSTKTLEYARAMGYKTIFWSFAYADWDNNNQASEEFAIKKIMDNIHNGAVLLLHPTSETNAKILDKVIKEIKARGYRFGTLDELTKNA